MDHGTEAAGAEEGSWFISVPKALDGWIKRGVYVCVFMLSLVLMQFCSPLMVLDTCPSYILEMRQREMNVKRVIRWKRKKEFSRNV